MIAKYMFFTDQGSRENNEDSVYVRDNDSDILAIVADGLGGHEKGELASKCAVEVVSKETKDLNYSEDVLRQAIAKANGEVLKLNAGEDKMMTTLAIAWINENSVIVSNVGDSRIYLLRENKIFYQSVDHSAAQLAVIMGEIEQGELRNHPDKNRLVRVVGNDEDVKPDIKTIDLQDGDRILMCSDGFWEYVLEDTIEKTSSNSENLEQWFEMLKCEYEKNKTINCDNCTAIVLEVQ